jgi:hypothetical protein
MKLAIIILASIILASFAVVWAGGLGLDLTVELSSTGGGEGGSAPACAGGYDELIGSDANPIHDSTGASICVPQ